MSFRQPEDMGAQRMMDTPEPESIAKKLDQTIADLHSSGMYEQVLIVHVALYKNFRFRIY